jgi:carboxyl-terminal processing protease
MISFARRCLFALTLTAAAACAATDGASGARLQWQAEGPMVVHGRIDPRLYGAWRVLGEGALLQIDAGGVTQYQQSRSLCYADDMASSNDPAALQGMSFKGRFGRGYAMVDLYELEGAPASSALERIGRIPPACLRPPRSDPATTFKAMCELMAQDYAFFVERRIDWRSRCLSLAPHAAAARSDDELQAVLIKGLSGFGDAHVKLLRGSGEERATVFSAGDAATGRMLRHAFEQQSEIKDFHAFQSAWRDGLQQRIAQRLSGASGPQLDGAMQWGRLPGNVGYIGVYRMKGFSADASVADDVRLMRGAMDRAVAALKDTKAMIVDVALNGGGLDVVSAEIAGTFADRPRLAFMQSWHRPQGRVAQPWYVEPKGAAQYLKRVYVLTSDGSASAAETFTLMMRALPHARQAGQTTAGSISDILTKPLPGRFAVTFASQIDRDPKGRLFEVTGIPPQWPLPIFRAEDPDTLFTGHAAAVEVLAEVAAR